MKTATTMLDAALEYAGRGVPVFPVWGTIGDRCRCERRDCGSPGKHPIAALVPHGVKDATTDVKRIADWWTRDPSANIATPTSWATVLDIDPRHGGDEAVAEFQRQHGPLPDTAAVLTGGGGRHLYFLLVPGLAPSAGKVGPGLDVKTGAGAYVLLPPSSHVDGRDYCDDLMFPLFDTPMAEAPGWLIARAAAAPSTSSNGHGPEGTDWAAELAGAPEGQRHQVAARIAGHLLGKKLPAGEVEEIVVGFAARCTPPFDVADCRRIVRDLAAKDAARGRTVAAAAGPAGDGLDLVSVGQLLAEPEDETAWVVEGRLPAAGLGLVSGKPKAGKSTAARTLALSVARGLPWLGFKTAQGPVIYLALEEKRAEVREHFRALGATAADPIALLCSSAPDDALARLRREADRRRPALLIIDPLFRFVRVEDGNDYATMTRALEPLLTLARETGAHVLLVHHLGKGQKADGDAILGSTAIFAAVDSALLLKRGDKYRTLSSIQRYGDDLEEIVLELDPDTRDLAAGPSRVEAEVKDAGELIIAYLGGAPAPVTEAEIGEAVKCRTQACRAALRALVKAGNVSRTGRGGKADPFLYGLVFSCS